MSKAKVIFEIGQLAQTLFIQYESIQERASQALKDKGCPHDGIGASHLCSICNRNKIEELRNNFWKTALEKLTPAIGALFATTEVETNVHWYRQMVIECMRSCDSIDMTPKDYAKSVVDKADAILKELNKRERLG